MELDECIRGRRSIRRYEDKPIPKKIIDSILEAGVWAPSGMNNQPWRFIVIENQEIMNKLSRRAKEILLKMDWPDHIKKIFKSDKDTIFHSAPLLILVCAEKKGRGQTFLHLDCGLAAENMFLKAYNEGVGSCFIGFANSLNQDPDILSEVGVPEGHELIAPLIFGYPSGKPELKPREIKILNWIK